MRIIIVYILSVAICLIIGMSAGTFQSDSLSGWYLTLNKSSLTPPGIMFPIVWTILYICIGLSLAFIIIKKPANRELLYALWGGQMIFNFLWSMLFFYLRNPVLGFVDIIVLDILVLLFILFTFNSIKISSLLFMPYMIWLLLATYLNGYIMFNN